MTAHLKEESILVRRENYSWLGVSLNIQIGKKKKQSAP
jgi:hypothetical protein